MRLLVLVTFLIVSVFSQASSRLERKSYSAVPLSQQAASDRSADPFLFALNSTTSEAAEFAPHIADVPILDQDGRSLHFYTDLVKGKVVAIQFIFTRCTTICPPLGATFSKLQRSFAPEMGKTVWRRTWMDARNGHAE